MADTSRYMFVEHLIAHVCVHEKERTGETYEEIRGNFFLRFNKAAPIEANLRVAQISQRATTGCDPT